jgi:hypothetical protein
VLKDLSIGRIKHMLTNGKKMMRAKLISGVQHD